MTPRETVRLECAFECLFNKAIEMLQPVPIGRRSCSMISRPYDHTILPLVHLIARQFGPMHDSRGATLMTKM